MSFRIIVNSSTADPSDVNSNFYHIMQGSLIPHGGDTLTSTTELYDLGNTNYRWNDLYINNIYASITFSGETTWKIVTEVYISVAAASVDISGVSGTTMDEYLLLIMGVSETDDTFTSVYIGFNGASSNGYSYFASIPQNDTILSESLQAQDRVKIGNMKFKGVGMDAATSLIQVNFNTKNIGHNARPILSQSMGGVSGTAITEFRFGVGTWNDANTTITTINLMVNNNFNVGTHIQLWGKT